MRQQTSAKKKKVAFPRAVADVLRSYPGPLESLPAVAQLRRTNPPLATALAESRAFYRKKSQAACAARRRAALAELPEALRRYVVCLIFCLILYIIDCNVIAREKRVRCQTTL
jgi:hypothetical protein